MNVTLDDGAAQESKRARSRSPQSTRSPQHRKSNRRIHSPPPYDPGGSYDDKESAYIPNTEDLAKSFLQDEPREETRELEALYRSRANVRQPEDSILSDASDDPALGTGTGLGLPGFLANFIHGIIDRVQVRIRNVSVKLDAELPSQDTDAAEVPPQTTPIAVEFTIAELDVAGVDSGARTTQPGTVPQSRTGNGQHAVTSERRSKRCVTFKDLHLDLISEAAALTGLQSSIVPSSPLRSNSSVSGPAASRYHSAGSSSRRRPSSTVSPSSPRPGPSHDTSRATRISPSRSRLTQNLRGGEIPTEEVQVTTSLRGRVAVGQPEPAAIEASSNDFDIRPGEDNESWAQRRNLTREPDNDPWTSTANFLDPSASMIEDQAGMEALQASELTALSRPTLSVTHSASTSSDDPPPTASALIGETEENQIVNLEATLYQSADLAQNAAVGQPSTDIASQTHLGSSHTSSTDDDDDNDSIPPNMATSSFLPNDQAESMYMSAISGGFAKDSPEFGRLPGQWESTIDDDDDDMEPNFLSESARTIYGETPEQGAETEDIAPTPRASSPSDNQRHELRPSSDDHHGPVPPANERASADSPSVAETPVTGTQTSEPVLEARRLLTIDTASLWIPNEKSSDEDTTANSGEAPQVLGTRPRSETLASSFHQIPGAFSQYADLTASKRLSASSVQESVFTLPSSHRENRTVTEQVLELSIGRIAAQTDVATARILHQVFQLMLRGFRPTNKESETASDDSKGPSQIPFALSSHLAALDLSLLDELSAFPRSQTQDQMVTADQRPRPGRTLFQINVMDLHTDVKLGSAVPDVELILGKFALGFEDRDVLSFTKPSASQTLGTRHTNTPDLTFRMSSKTTLQQSSIVDVNLVTLPIQIDLDLQAFDQAFETFGGLSGVVELSASVLSNGAMSTKESSSSPRKKGVRFENEPAPRSQSTEIKLSANIGGLGISLGGRTCSVILQSSGLKLLSRPKYIHATVSKVKLSGPYVRGEEEVVPPSVTLEKSVVSYYFSPEDVDLERLLSLLTPSKNKYENDDDIILDTLLRQRRKGAALRISFRAVSAQVSDWAHLTHIQSLADELGKFAAVAKYLPEDERPGLLTLANIGEFRAHLPTTAHFGMAEIECTDLEVAHVGLPALLALAVGTLHVGRKGEQRIIHAVTPVTATEKLPMVMARMIGDEAEPTFKVKLFNICLEYSIPTFLALTGLDVTAPTEEVVQDLAASVWDVTGMRGQEERNLPPGSDQPQELSTKKLNVDLLLHDCAIGLQPRDGTAKGLFILNNTRFTTIVPPEKSFEATLDIRKASLYITDDEVPDSHALQKPPPPSLSSDRLAPMLLDRGYVSVSSIMSAKADVRIQREVPGDIQPVVVDFRNQLFVLESCADSTQTLIAILSGLSPPMPPSKEPKFRTEAMTMEDMVASFTGNAYAKPESPPSTLFDADNDLPPSPEDDLLVESEMTESLYGPLEGFPNDLEADEFHDEDPPGDIAESLLEDDPFEMPTSPTLQRLSDDALLKDLNKQCSSMGVPVELKPFYIPSGQLDKFYGTAGVLGAPYRFNTPAVAFPSSGLQQKLDNLPLKLQVRDVHVIWNLYDGYDWQRTRTAISDAVQEVENKAEERRARRRRSGAEEEEDESVIEDFLFNSIYIGVPASKEAQDLRRQINHNINDLASETESYATSGVSRPTNQSGQQYKPRARQRRLKLERSKAHKVAFELKGVSADVLMFPPGTGETQSSVDVRVRDFEIFDNIPTSTWRKFLTYMHDENNMREMMKPMIHLEMQNVRPVEDLAATELVMRVSTALNPFRLMLIFPGLNPSSSLTHRSRCFRLHHTLLRVQG